MKEIFKLNTLFKKILLWYGLGLLLFSIVSSILFCSMYVNHVYDTYLIDMAKGLSTALSVEVENSGSDLGSKEIQDVKTYKNIISGPGSIDGISVWIVTKDRQLLSLNRSTHRVEFDQIPTRYTEMLDDMFAGNDVHNNSYRKIWNRNMFGVGTPIVDSGGFIIGVVLVQASFDIVKATLLNVIKSLFYSSIVALAVTFLIGLTVSKVLTQPLEKIKTTALMLQDGDYSAKTGVCQTDELGELALVMDELAGRLAAAKKESDNLEQMRQNFISGISHELRTPVTVMRGSLEALCDGVVTDPQKVSQYLTTMLKDSIHLQRLVNDLLDLSKLQAPELQMNMVPCNPMEILQDAIWSIQPLADEKKIDMELHMDKSWEQSTIMVDYGRIRQLFTILLDNAIKFTDSGKKITVRAYYRNGLKCVFEDEGCGIPSDEVEYIFDRFYRASTTSGHPGSGLGLAIASQIATRHGITLSCTSFLNTGTRFKVTFPASSSGTANPPADQ